LPDEEHATQKRSTGLTEAVGGILNAERRVRLLLLTLPVLPFYVERLAPRVQQISPDAMKDTQCLWPPP